MVRDKFHLGMEESVERGAGTALGMLVYPVGSFWVPTSTGALVHWLVCQQGGGALENQMGRSCLSPFNSEQ